MDAAVKLPLAWKKNQVPENLTDENESTGSLEMSLVDAFVRHMKDNPDKVTSDISSDQVTLGSWRNRREYKVTTLKIQIKEPINN